MQHGLLAVDFLNAFMYTNICHCSTVTNLVKWRPPEGNIHICILISKMTLELVLQVMAIIENFSNLITYRQLGKLVGF